MGWWPFGGTSGPSVETPKAAATPDGAYEAPDRSSRARCWDSRDALFKCLDKNDILDPLKEDAKSRKVCAQENQAYEENCATSWVKYFKQRRVAEWEKEQIIKRQSEDMFAKK